MINQLEEMIIRQRTVELNNRLDRLYVPPDPEKETHGARFSLAALRVLGWLTHAGAALEPRSQSAAPRHPDTRHHPQMS